MRYQLFFFFVLLYLLSACSSLKITSDYDKEIDFTNYKTYSFYGWENENNSVLNSIDKKRIEGSFVHEFNNRHLSFTPADGDLVVSLYLATNISATAYTNHYSSNDYGDFPAWAWPTGHSNTTRNESDNWVGTLMCNVFDNDSKQLIWQGVASDEIDEKSIKKDNTITPIATGIMSKYPISIMKK